MKTKKTLLNIITDVFPLIIISLLGLYKVRLFIRVLGSETLGLYQLFNNIMVYVALVDGGLTSALLFSLYKPNADGNHKKINELLSAGFTTFSKIGMYVFTIATIVSFFIVFLIKETTFSYWYIVLTFFLFSISNTIEYFFVPYNALLEVKEKKYILNVLTQGAQIIISIVEIVLLLLNKPFVYLLISHVIVKIIIRLIQVYICKKEFPYINVHERKKDYSFKKLLNSLIVHKVNGLVGSNIDSLIISSLLGLNAVAIYSTYNYIVTMLKNMLGKLSSSMTALIGNSLQHSTEKMYELYLEINSFLFYVAIIICVPLVLAINLFIDLFYEGNITSSFAMALSFSLVLFVYTIRMSSTLFVNAGGLYKETRHCAIIDTIVNLVLSIILIFIMGIPGVLIATSIAMFIAEYILKTKVVYRHVFKKDATPFFIRNIKFFILLIIDFMVCFMIVSMLHINSLIVWFVSFSILTIINSIIILFIFKLLGEDHFYHRFLSILPKR